MQFNPDKKENEEYKVEGECCRCLECCKVELENNEWGWCQDFDVEKKTCKFWGTDELPDGCRIFPTIEALNTPDFFTLYPNCSFKLKKKCSSN